MLGHYINVQPEKVWDHWLTKPFRAGEYDPDKGEVCGCLVGERWLVLTGGYEDAGSEESDPCDNEFNTPGLHFDGLCRRFGEARIQRAVRNRILTMKAHKALRSPPVREAAVS